MAGTTDRKGLATVLAIIGSAVSVLTFYYARHDAREKAAGDRPIVEVTSARLIDASQGQTAQQYNVQLSIANRGTQIAADTTLEQQSVPAGSTVSWNRAVALGNLAPAQERRQLWTVSVIPLRLNEIVRVYGVLHYKSRVDSGVHFDEPFCVEAGTLLAKTTRRELLPGVYDFVFDTPIEMRPCVMRQ